MKTEVKTLAIAAACLGFTGCATTPDQLASKSDLDVCKTYGVFANGIVWGETARQYKTELERRNILSASEWQTVNSKQIQRGMSLCALYASWGRPSRENNSTGSWGTHTQHVYNAGLRHVRPTYVYTQNGVVKSWQN